jgi:hypothetical protein
VKELAQAVKKEGQLEKRAFHAERKLEKAEEKITLQRREIYGLETELEEEKGKNPQLKAQLNRDYENSSLPSSRGSRRKRIPNSREKTGRRPGGQPGHPGHVPKSRKRTQPLWFSCRRRKFEKEYREILTKPPPAEASGFGKLF